MKTETTAYFSSRRRFLKRAAAGSIGTSLSLASTSVAQMGLSDEIEEQPLVPVVEATSDKLWAGSDPNPEVIGEMVDKALVKLTLANDIKSAWKNLVLPNDIVAIKVNPLAAAGEPLGRKLATNPVIVQRIVDGLYEAGVLANQVIVWDRFQRHLVDAGFNINAGGKDLQCFATDSSGIGYDQEVFYETEEDIFNRREKGLLKSFYSRIITEMATVIINVPVFKHNGITGLSGCLKNLAFGSVNNTSRFHSNPLNCDPAISEIFAHTVIKNKLVLNVVDGLYASYNGGPVYDPNSVWKAGRIMASADPVILDQIMLESLDEKRRTKNLEPVRSLAKYIRSAERAELGTSDLDKADLQEVKV